MSGDQTGNRLIGVEDGIVIIGTTNSTTNSNILLMKVDFNGQKVWERHIVSGSEGFGIKQMQDGNFLLSGSVSASIYNKDVLLVVTDRDGHVLMQRTFGGVLNDIGRDAIELPNGDIMILGTSSSFGPGVASMYVICTEPNGNMIWSRTFGGYGVDGGSELLQKNGVEILLLGFTDSFGAGNRDIYLQGVSVEGDSLASFTFGGPDYEESQSFAITANGGLVMCNHTASSDPDHNMMATALDANYGVIWEQEFGGLAHHDGGEGMLIDGHGNYLFLGRTNSYSQEEQVLLVKTNPDGHILEELSIGGEGDQRGNDIIEHLGYYYICGTSNVGGDSDVLLIKLPM